MEIKDRPNRKRDVKGEQKLKSFTLKITMGFCEAEMLVKALKQYNPKKECEKYSQEDLIELIEKQIAEAKEMLEGEK